jgi:branched-chain amino acid transport system permease protein
VSNRYFILICAGVAAAAFLVARAINNDYLFFAGYVILNFIVLATAWNILGGYCGYVNFGSAGFFAVGAYTSVALHKLPEWLERHYSDEAWTAPLMAILPLPIPVLIVVAGVIAGVIGFGTGYLTLRLRGVFFAIATLALAVVLQTLIINWPYVGGSRGAYIIPPNSVPVLGPYIQYLFLLMLILVVVSLAVARGIERSQLGYGFATIRDDELAAEASGVPTLKLKLVATTVSGALMGMSGAPFPYYIGYLEPSSAFGLAYAVNSIAMPMIGGTTNWIGPLIGAILLGTLQQAATVMISSAVNLLIVGLILVFFVIIAPNGIIGLVQEFLRAAAPARLDRRAVIVLTIALYGLVAGFFGIVLGLAAAVAADKLVAGVGLFTLFLAIMNLAASYGLLKLEHRSRPLATVTFALWIPLGVLQLWINPAGANVVLQGFVIVGAAAIVWYLQTRDVADLYRAHASEERAAA